MFLTIFDLRSSIVLTYSIAAYPVCYLLDMVCENQSLTYLSRMGMPTRMRRTSLVPILGVLGGIFSFFSLRWNIH